MMLARVPRRALSVAALILALAAVAACTSDDTPPAPPADADADGGAGATGTSTASGTTSEPLTGKEFDPANFGDDSTTIDNPWLPMQPGTRLVLEGTALDDGEPIERRVVMTFTDLTKVIGGVRTVVAYDLDYNDDEMVESDIAFFAQDVDGNIWQLGEYPEEYEEGEIVKAPIWIHGIDGARAGLTITAHHRVGTPSHAQGWGPAVGWNDRAQTYRMGVGTCVPVECYDEVLVVREFNRDEPGAWQLKYYAPGVGNVRIGWMGPNEEEQEELELVDLELLTPNELAKVRATVLEQEARGYESRPNVYGLTEPMESLAA